MTPTRLHWILFSAVTLVIIGEIFFILGQKETVSLPTLKEIPPSFLSPLLGNRPLPAKVLDLSRWKITLPVSRSGGFDTPLEVTQPELSVFSADPWFVASPDGEGVIFRAPVDGVTTSGSDYPRSELRELSSDGENMYWSSTDGTHTLFLDESITAVPQQKPEVVAGQIHGDDDDLLAIRLEYPRLFLARGKNNLATLDETYALGKRFTIRFVVEDGTMSVYYNGSTLPAYTLEKKVQKAYFKAGAYTQSNCKTEGNPALCHADNYGEVILYNLEVQHE